VYDATVDTDEWLALELDELAALRFRQRAWATVEAYFALVTPHEVAPVAQELAVEAEIDGVPFRGYIDLVEAAADGSTSGADDRPAVVVTDYKTGRPPERGKPWSAEREADRLLQPQWYAAALAELGGHRPVRARLLYFTAVDLTGGGFRTETRELGVAVDAASLAPARAELRRRWDAIQSALDAGSAPASPGPLCGWCPFVELCDEGAAECRRRWNEVNDHTGERRLREDAPAAVALGLVEAPAAVG
jgi:putative RecB family exonuclease